MSAPRLRFVCLACHRVVHAPAIPARCRCGGRDFGAPAATLRALGLAEPPDAPRASGGPQ